jgi:hypothetical protein
MKIFLIDLSVMDIGSCVQRLSTKSKDTKSSYKINDNILLMGQPRDDFGLISLSYFPFLVN